MKTIRLSCAHALFKFLIAQKTIIDGKKVPLFPGAFAMQERCAENKFSSRLLLLVRVL